MNLIEQIETILVSMGSYGVVLSCLLIVIESILPVLPLAIFITLNCLILGTFMGLFTAYFFTIIGCILAYYLVSIGLKKWFDYKLYNKKTINKFAKSFEKLTFSELVVLISIPFTPAFLVNIAAALTNLPFKKFFIAILIGKISLVIFWGYIGVTLIESLTNPIELVKILILVVVMYIISKIINKKLKID